MNKDKLFGLLRELQSGRCIVQGCAHRGPNHYLCLHRVIPGHLGGGYTEDNTVLVCTGHHRMIEGRTKAELLNNHPGA